VALERERVGADRRADIAVFISQACSNVVVYAYVGTSPGPLYAAATLADRDLIVSVGDCGRGMVARPDSAGAGLGVPLMTRDRLWKASAAAGEGTWPHGTFGRAIAAPARAANELTRHDDRGAMLREYLCVLEADHAALGEDTEAVLAQARHVVARARRQRRERARRRQSLQPRAPLAPHPGQRGATSGTEPQSANGALNAVATPRQSESVRAKAQDARSSSAAGADGYPAGVSRSRETGSANSDVATVTEWTGCGGRGRLQKHDRSAAARPRQSSS
jgi:hypothetical protein